MSNLDIGLAVILIFFTYQGLMKGLIRSIGRIFGLIIGAYVASNYYLLVFEWSRDWVTGYEIAGKIGAFIILFIAATQLTQLIFFIIEKIFNLLAIIPGSKYINNVLGGLLGLIEGSLFLGLIIFVVSRYAVINDLLSDLLVTSIIVPWLLKIVNIILPVLPESLKALNSII